ncbi:hypothetical protein GRX03_11915 [Halovenus sp. WSH3]|uniref:DUF7978 domain-containing protein n=1 Tax=Halovenus carboxidivorans TaxID=2692199 RepID=A0A6B0T2T7_9EURY|nr:hypothetical protein [Halovenus carboxidivorans]MXR52305.1 hypothetical protein [Halovenus carboxidivorans]
MASYEPKGNESTSIPVVGGLIYGVAAYIVGFIVTLVYLLTTQPETGNELQNIYQFEPGTGTNSELLINTIGWIYYNAQTVPIQITGRDGSQITVNALREIGAGNPLIYNAIPAVVLIIFGIILAQRASATSARSGLVAGTALVVGYGILAVGGALFFKISAQGLTYQLPLTNAVLIVGIAYPVIGGGVGGVIKGSL